MQAGDGNAQGGAGSVLPRGSDPGHHTAALETVRARQQAIAELTGKALVCPDLSVLLQEATALVARTLRVEYGKLLELLPDSGGLFLRAGVGWRDGYVGRAVDGSERSSPAGYTVMSSQPVVVDDLQTEKRFSAPALLTDHDVVSGITVPIQGPKRLFGVLGVNTKERRTFLEEEVSFLQAIAGVLGIVIEHQRAQEMEQAVLAVIPGMLFRFDRNGRYLDFVPALGLEPYVPPGEFMGKRLVDVMPNDVAEPCQLAIERALETGEVQVVEYRFTRDEALVRREVRFAACGSNEVLALVQDVTERWRADEARQVSEERFRLLAEHAQDIIFRYRYTEPRGWEYVSPAVIAVGGYTPEEFYADPDFARKVVHPEDQQAFDEMERELLTGPLELRWIRKDGSLVWTEQRNTFVYDQAGSLVAIVGIVRDISEQKRMEAALQEAREQVEEKAERQVCSANLYDLTFREVTVLHLIAAGKADKEIAGVLGISALTASKHVANILMKMGATSRTGAGVRAVREGLID